MQDRQPLGEVRAGDSLLMTSGSAQCRIDGEATVAASEWHLAALTLVLGVHQSSDSDSDDGFGVALVSTVRVLL